MDHSVIIVLSIVVLLGACCLLLPLASKFSIPYSALLALTGIGVGFLATLSAEAGLPLPLSDILGAVAGMDLSGHVFLYVFLPSLLFAAGLSVDVRRLMDDVAPVLIMAIVAVVVSTLVVGASLSVVFAVPLTVALLLGAVIATTDPAAVVAIFRDIGVPRRLQILVEGESLFNDAAAIALFTMLVGSVAGVHSGSVLLGAAHIVVDFLGGLLLGYLAARAVCALLHLVSDHPVAEVTLTLCLAYTIYIVGDVYLKVSGVVATVTAALVIGSIGRTHLTAEGWNRLQAVWHQIEFLASTLIFVLAATMIPGLLADLKWSDAAMLAVVAVATLLARAAVLYGLMPILSAARLAQEVSASHKAVILWGGLRGAVTLAMALSVVENPQIPKEHANLIAALATGFVLLTLFVNAPTLRPLIGLLGLNRLSPVETALRERTIAIASESVRDSLAGISLEFGVEGSAGKPGLPMSDAKGGDGNPAQTTMLEGRDSQKVGLITLAAREEELYLLGHGDRTISKRIIGRCIAQAGRLRDAARTGGLAGYLQVADAALRPTASFRAALVLYNRFGFATPLARLLGYRFEVLLVTRTVLHRLREFTRRSIAPMLGSAVEADIMAALDTRHAGIDTAIRAFEVQYPDYAQLLRASYLGRAALRLEEAEYRQKRDDGLISPEVYRSLAEEMRRRREALGGQPVLDLGLEVTAMIRSVPLFASLDEQQLQIIARLLRPRLVVPGELIIRKGERGEAMYFITAGTVEIVDSASRTRVVREAGGYFGEIALIYNTPRTAEVTARGYCHLLVLLAQDLQRLLRQHPEARAEIERTASARLGPDSRAAKA
jgi:CPA1 family monovalent cation:H+ antiporter